MRFEDHKVIPVIKINDANKAEALARALLDGGIAAVEITLRTEAGLHAIKRIAEGVPEMTVGAGSVLDKAQAEAAYRAGAEFIVSPGAAVVGRPLKAVNLPKECLVCAYVRDNEAYVPNGDSVLEAGDRAILFIRTQHAQNVMKFFKGNE